MNSAVVINNQIIVKSKYEDRLEMGKIKGRKWNPNARSWSVPYTGLCCLGVIEFINNTGGSVSDEIKLLAGGALLREKVIIDEAPEKLPFNAVVKTDPMQHQYRGYLMHQYSDASFPAWDMGTGKTKVAIDIICNSLPSSKHLIICPKRVVDNWPDEFAKHASCDIQYVRLDLGNAKKIAKEMESWLSKHDKLNKPLVFLINYDTCWRSSIAKIILENRWEFVCLDESHRAKSPTGRLGKFVVELSYVAKTRMCLSGTPMPNGPLDIFNQLKFLDVGLLGANYTAFKAEYTTKAKVEYNGDTLIIEAGYSDELIKGFKGIDGAQFYVDEDTQRKLWINHDKTQHKSMLDVLEHHKKSIKTHIGYKNLDKLYSLLGKIMHRITKDEALDLPDLIYNRMPVDISQECRRLSNEMKEELYTLISTGEMIEAKNAAVRMLRCLQFASGCTKDVDGVNHQIDFSKQEALYDLLLDLPDADKVVVFYWFVPNCEAIAAAASDADREIYYINGQQDQIRDWNDAKPGSVIAVQIQSGSEGVNLTAAHQVVYFSTGWRLKDFQQSQSRCHRKGQEHKVNLFHLFATGTFEEKVAAAFEAKEEVIEYVLGNMNKTNQEEQSNV